MSSIQQVAGGLSRLAIWSATNNRLLSTYSRAQKWTNPSKESKYYGDPEWRIRQLERSSTIMARRRQNPELREKLLANSRAWNAKSRQAETYKLWERFYQWCVNHDWVRDQLPWKTYKPRLYPKKVEHYCMGCRFTQRNGHRLWWCRISESSSHAERGISLEELSADGQYLCSNCYRKTEDIMPQGFEDVTSMKDCRARAKELGTNIDKKSGQEAQLPDQAPRNRSPTHEFKV